MRCKISLKSESKIEHDAEVDTSPALQAYPTSAPVADGLTNKTGDLVGRDQSLLAAARRRRICGAKDSRRYPMCSFIAEELPVRGLPIIFRCAF
jgi:hypothetical protein